MSENTDISLWFNGNEDMTIDLLDCPFCGNRPYMHQIGNIGTGRKYSIKTGCKSCRFSIVNGSLGSSDFSFLVNCSIDHWNKRVDTGAE